MNRILLIESKEETAEKLMSKLQLEHIETEVASSGQEALSLLESQL